MVTPLFKADLQSLDQPSWTVRYPCPHDAPFWPNRIGVLMEADHEPDAVLRQVLEPGEQVHWRAMATDAVLAVTDRRLVVAAPTRVALAIPFEGVRRIQFDIERNRPATLVVVPELGHHEPQVLAIPPEQYHAAAAALVALGLALAPMDPSVRPEE